MHTCVADRQKAAQLLRSRFEIGSADIPILLDSMANEFDAKFAVWPERYYLVWNGVMHTVAEPTTEFGYDRDALHWAMQNLAASIVAAKQPQPVVESKMEVMEVLAQEAH